MRLVGIVRQDGEPSRALIRFANEPAGKWIAEGEEANGWVLRAVNEHSVVLEGGGRFHELQLNLPQRRPAEEAAPDMFEAKPQRLDLPQRPPVVQTAPDMFEAKPQR